MTFIVNHDGVVYQKDLGKDTAKLAKAIKKYDPDKIYFTISNFTISNLTEKIKVIKL